MRAKLEYYWKWFQEVVSVDGGIYVDAFAIVMLVRLLAPLRRLPPMNSAEAGIWAATIASFAYSGRGPKQS